MVEVYCEYIKIYYFTLSSTMIALINRLLDWIKSLFWKEEMELTLVGLQYSGKTTFVNVIAVRNSKNGCSHSFIVVVILT